MHKFLSPRLACASQVKSAKAGLVTPQLREALGMEEGAPPPWLINMQRYGPPPSYPDLPVSARLLWVLFDRFAILQQNHSPKTVTAL